MGLAQSLAAKVAQMVVVRASGHLFDHQIQYPAWEPSNAKLTHWVQKLNVGGVILLGGSAAEIGLRTQHLQDLASTPLLMAADIEEGVGQRFTGATWFPPPMAIAHIARHDLPQAIAYAEAMGAAIAQEALAIGLNWVLAPVVDVNNNPDNPVINVRAFGDDPAMVSELAAAFIRGAHTFPVLTSAKHFPGHGDTATDSHLELPVIPHDRTRLDAVELPPFKAAIAAGVDTIMTAHLQIPALDPDNPATLSPNILTGLLRNDLGFDGLITTDALVMGAIANRYGSDEAAILAVEAGADILLMPADPEGAIQSVCNAVDKGRISPDRIQESYERIRWAKQGIGSPHLGSSHLGSDNSTTHAWENIAPPAVQLDQLAQPEVRETAIAILKDSMVCHGSNPLPFVQSGQNIILIDSSLNCNFLNLNAPAITLPNTHGYRNLTLIDQNVQFSPDQPSEVREGVGAWGRGGVGEQGSRGAGEQGRNPLVPNSKIQNPKSKIQNPTVMPNVLLQLFVRGNPFRGSAGMGDRANALLHELLEQNCLAGVVVYGSPYLWETIKSSLPANLPAVFTYGQMPMAQALVMRSLFGKET